MDNNDQLTPNCLAFIALANEYCQLMEEANYYERSDFVERVSKLLPRIYISALDMTPSMMLMGNGIASSLQESQYNDVKARVETVMADENVYLEVFMENMKYSDTPIATTISENLADLYQEFYEMLAAINDLTVEHQQEILSLCRDNFDEYWSQTLCNVLRAVNQLRNNQPIE